MEIYNSILTDNNNNNNYLRIFLKLGTHSGVALFNIPVLKMGDNDKESSSTSAVDDILAAGIEEVVIDEPFQLLELPEQVSLTL